MNRGTKVTAIAYGGKHLRRRVWEDSGNGVMLCTEEGYQRALAMDEEPLCSGFPKSDVVEVKNNPGTSDTDTVIR